MDKHSEQLDRIVKQLWGPEASLSGAAAKGEQPGRFDIHLGASTLGSGPTFQEAINHARRCDPGATPDDRQADCCTKKGR